MDIPVNDILSTFEQKLKRLMNQHKSSKRLSGISIKPWITKASKAYHRNRKNLFIRQRDRVKPNDRLANATTQLREMPLAGTTLKTL
ncbi:hypothetical protein DPMN_011557 [Dreissena polymorpha]|uniref:Uncharacterized protein n=1 Tax=Dreissena polymorpha TaxID=45954 RepID=A0A9D4N1Z1_DREPO|nr:hypothetical protein DPMN_011557 [Dreissena polymorpha]